jgi:chromosome segregation ATPase
MKAVGLNAQTHQNQVDELKAVVHALSTDENKYAEQIRTFSLRHEKDVLEIGTLKTAISVHTSRISELEAKLREAAAQNEENLAKVSTVEQERATVEQEKEDLQTSIELLEERHAGLRLHTETLNGIIEKSKKEKDELNELIQSLTARNASWRENCENIQHQLNMSKALNDQLCLKQKGFDKQMNELKTRLAQLSKEKADVSRHWADDQRTAKIDYARLEQENKELRAKLATYNAEILSGVGSERLVSEMMASMMAKRRSPEPTDEQIRCLALKIDALELEKSNQAGEIRTLQRENGELRSELLALQKRLTEWKSAQAMFELQHPPSEYE